MTAPSSSSGVLPVIELTVDELGRLEPLAQGGQAKLYDCPDLQIPGEQGPFVYKAYKSRILAGREAAIRNGMGRLLAVRSDPANRQKIDRFSVWPVAVVLPAANAHGACGLIMRRLPRRCFVDIRLFSGTKSTVHEVVHLMQTDEELTERGLDAMSDLQRWHLLLAIATFMEFLHSNDVILGDLSGKNIAIRTVVSNGETKHYPVLMDADGFRFHGAQPHLPQANTPAWIPPEIERIGNMIRALESQAGADPNEIAKLRAQSLVLSKKTDVYKFGLLLNRVLHRGMTSPNDSPANSAPTTVCVSEHAFVTMEESIGIGARRADRIKQSLSRDPAARPTMGQLCTAMFGR